MSHSKLKLKRNENVIYYSFSPISCIVLQFLVSILQLMCVTAILTLQISLTLTKSCPYQIGIGFWSSTILLICPLSIWMILWRPNSTNFYATAIIQSCSNFLLTGIIITSILMIINHDYCPLSSITTFFIPMNSLWISFGLLFKLCNYVQLLLLYKIHQNMSRSLSLVENRVELSEMGKKIRKYPLTEIRMTENEINYAF